MLGSVLGYFFSVITVFAGVMTFMALLIGVSDNSTFEKLRRYPRPIIERIEPAPPNQEPHHILNPEPHRRLFALGTNDAAAPKESAPDKKTKASPASSAKASPASSAKANAENRKLERKIRPERLAHLREPKVPARQRQNYEGYGYAMTLGSEGRRGLELNGQ